MFVLCLLTAAYAAHRLPVLYPMDLSDIAQEFLSPLHLYYCGNEYNSCHLQNRSLILRGNSTVVREIMKRHSLYSLLFCALPVRASEHSSFMSAGI